jgi:hypothetical protein
MDSLSVVLPYDFVTMRIKLTWRDILYAIDRQFLSPNAAIEHAIIELSKIEEFPQSLLDLASLNKNESIHPYLDQLADLEPEQPIEDIDEKWIYLILAWVFENRDNCSDPFGIVEQIYADFNYPEQISAFIRYMPSDEPDLGSPELNEARLYKKWEDYLKERDNKYNPTKDGD